jgi:hypothetical protein
MHGYRIEAAFRRRRLQGKNNEERGNRMNGRILAALAATLLLAGCTAGQSGLDRPIVKSAEDLNGASGHAFHVDEGNKRFELLKETVYDPETGAGTSWHTVYWTDATTVTEVAEKTDFAGLNAPVLVDFHGIDDTNSKALAEGRAFVARVAVVMPDEKVAAGVNENNRQIVSWFTPDKGRAPRGGTIEVNGKPVKVSLRRRHARIYLRRKLAPKDLATGFWKTTIQGKNVNGKFVIESMEVSALVDPRTVDDPDLPRVLVVGDSISMNYHNAAKSALKGVANYHRNEGNCFSTVHGVKNMELWLGDYKAKGLHWDVIQFNHGLHDLKQAYDKSNDTWGDYAVSLEDYRKNLEKEIAILKKTGAKLIWCSTTPVPNSNTGRYARREGAAREFNKAAMEVMRKHPEIQINDLHRFVCETKAFDKWRTGRDVHFWDKDLQDRIGKAVADAITKALRGDGPR